MRKLSLILFVFCLISCKSSLDSKEELFGSYLFNHVPNDSIILKSDMTYLNKVISSKGTIIVYKGIWNFNKSEQRVSFLDKSDTLIEDEFRRILTSWNPEVEKKGGKACIIYASEEGQYYEKIK